MSLVNIKYGDIALETSHNKQYSVTRFLVAKKTWCKCHSL